MKPDVKRILAKLSKEKVELATEKVDLSLPNLNRMADGIEQKWKVANKSINVEGNKMLNNVVEKLRFLNESIFDLAQEKKDFVRKAEALGLDRATIEKELTKIETALKAGKKQSDDLTQRIAQIRNAIF